MKAREFIKDKVYRTTEDKQVYTCYLRFSHFNQSHTPYFKYISGICNFNKDGSYVVIPSDMVLYEIQDNETTF